VESAQDVSEMCFVCGEENPLGLHARFLNLADGRVAALFTPGQQHQGYPGRMHGGVIGALLDELIGRVIQLSDPEAFAVTIELNVRYRKPVPLDGELKAVAWAVKDGSRTFEGAAELLLPDGAVAAQATGKYVKLPVETIAGDLADPVAMVPDTRPLPASIEL